MSVKFVARAKRGPLLPERGWNLPPPLYQFIAKKKFFKYNLVKFLKYITFSSSLIIFESLPKLYLKNCFFSIKCQNGGVEFHPRSGSTGEGCNHTSCIRSVSPLVM